MKKIILLVLSIGQYGIAQNIIHHYGISGEIRYDIQQEEYIIIDATTKNSTSTVAVDEVSKSIFISRDILLPNGETSRTLDTYDYVKMEQNGKEDYIFYGVDLLNKKYVEFLINPKSTTIKENCNLMRCENLTLLTN